MILYYYFDGKTQFSHFFFFFFFFGGGGGGGSVDKSPRLSPVVHTTLLLHHCQVLTVFNTFIIKIRPSRTHQVQHVLTMSSLRLRRSHYAHTTFSLRSPSPYKYYDKCCSTSNLESLRCAHRLCNIAPKRGRELGSASWGIPRKLKKGC